MDYDNLDNKGNSIFWMNILMIAGLERHQDKYSLQGHCYTLKGLIGHDDWIHKHFT